MWSNTILQGGKGARAWDGSPSMLWWARAGDRKGLSVMLCQWVMSVRVHLVTSDRESNPSAEAEADRIGL